MEKRELFFLVVCTIVLSVFVTCDDSIDPLLSNNEQSGDNEDTVVVNGEDFENTVADALAANCRDHEDTGDYIWYNSEVIHIVLNGNSITADGTGATIDGSQVTITAAGTYGISGSLADGQIIVNIEDKEVVRLILNGVDISSSKSAPVYVTSAKKTIIVLAENTENFVTDGTSYIYTDTEEDEPNAAIFSMSDLTIYGAGTLTIDGNYNDGISSKDGLIITGGTINVVSADDGIRGKDYLVVKDGNITVNAGGDGLKSDNAEDATKGYISIETGILNITSAGDAIAAETDVLIADGEIILSSGGGSSIQIDESISAKGLKAIVNTIIDGGTFAINSADDAIHSNGSLVINRGVFDISSGDDGIHSDSTLGVYGGDINIAKSYEGIESAVIKINYGNIHIISGDDGLNGAGGNDGSGMDGRPPGPGDFMTAGNYYLYINGGYIVIDALGDGVDINGSIVMTGGALIVNGPTQNMNGALDYDSSFKISGGFLLAAGSSGMAQAPGTSSTQYSVLVNFSAAQKAGTLVRIQTNGDQELFTFAPTKTYQSIAFSSPELTNGSTYDIYTGGSSTGAAIDGLYQDGTYTPGILYTSFTVSGSITKIGNSGFNPGG